MADNNINGEEKLIAVARQIAKSLGHSNSMTDDIFNIFSTFDGRFSRDKLSPLSDNMLPENHPKSVDKPSSAVATLEECLTSLEAQISHSLSSDRPLWFDPTDSSAFLEVLDELIATIRDFAPLARDNKALAVTLDRADELLQSAIFKLEEEFRGLIQRGADSFDLTRESSDSDSEDGGGYGGDDGGGEIPVAHPVTDFNIVIDALPASTINDLHEIARRMVLVEYGRECSHVYSACRREFLEESLSRLGLQKLSTDEVQKLPWPELEDEIERWCKSAVFSLRILFPSERRLCDRIFFGFPSTSDFAFMEVCRGSAIQLLNFADAVAISSRSPERLFKVLDVYETLRDLIPEFEILFSDQYCVFLRNEAVAIWKRVGEAIRGIFMELENLIRRDPAKNPVPGGGLHPITRYVMNYIRAACKSQQTLEQVFEEERERGMSGMSSLSVQMAWIMELLESNLEAKSKTYKDAALSSLFMMNNGRYIVQKVKDSELGLLLGEDWIRKHSVKVRQFQMNYQRNTWNKVVGVLKVDNGGGSNANGGQNSRPLKERFKMFNAYFEEILKIQSSWVVFDDQLREDLKMSVIQNLLPAYRIFIGRFQNSAEAGRNPEKHIKYSVEDVEAQINNGLFRGNSNGGRR
ncbi:exocyst complex component EXO70B1-like [Chenopodium quinoa]|uniref:Exocyst subunit Exo70 family protein n=1 Tax=Chenopodium quinoa TaxID=63459 RepID=A0A803LCS6_CHEQI|nr:exocyst complex component EXO70B1-like [Chenopodium quinoa]